MTENCYWCGRPLRAGACGCEGRSLLLAADALREAADALVRAAEIRRPVVGSTSDEGWGYIEDTKP